MKVFGDGPELNGPRSAVMVRILPERRKNLILIALTQALEDQASATVVISPFPVAGLQERYPFELVRRSHRWNSGSSRRRSADLSDGSRRDDQEKGECAC